MWRWIHRIDIIHESWFLSLCVGELGKKYAHLAQNYYSSAIHFKSIMPTWAHFPCKLVCNGWRCLFKWRLHKTSRRKLHRKNHFHKINRQTNSTSTMNRTQCFPLFECSRHDNEGPGHTTATTRTNVCKWAGDMIDDKSYGNACNDGDKTTKNKIRKCHTACVEIDVGTFSVGKSLMENQIKANRKKYES